MNALDTILCKYPEPRSAWSWVKTIAKEFYWSYVVAGICMIVLGPWLALLALLALPGGNLKGSDVAHAISTGFWAALLWGFLGAVLVSFSAAWVTPWIMRRVISVQLWWALRHPKPEAPAPSTPTEPA